MADVTQKSESIIVELIITEPEDIELLQHNTENVCCEVISITPTGSYWKVQIMAESPTMLYLLGRYIGCDRKRIHNLDF